jgi:uncharacterized membrane protein YheB (UPF0754 family)
MSLMKDYKTKLRMAFDRQLPAEARAFAALECLFQPVSFATLIAAVTFAVSSRFGRPMPAGLARVFPILLSAAVGYLTNWIAIEMLFKPYKRTWRHPFAWLTGGYWRQGLVPKNKDAIAVVMGEQVATKLLQPEKLADDLCSMVGGVLEDKSIVASVQDALQRLIGAHDKEIVACLSPKIEEALVAEIDRLVTAENVETFWNEQIEPKLQSEETRNEIASILIGALDKRAPKLATKVKPMVVSAIRNWVEEKGGMLGTLLSPVAEKLADAIVDRRTIERGLRDWLNDPETLPALRDELLQFIKTIRAYLKSPEAQAKVGGFVADIRAKFKEYLRNYLETHFAETVGGILHSEQLWQWAASLIPRFRPELENLIRTKGLPLIVKKLDIEGRIKTAVDNMDVEEFHGMVNDVAAQHLGAIQVLGYILGALAGGLLLLARF